MSLESDLTPRIDLIKRLVRERYVEYLNAQSWNEWDRVELNEDGEIVDALPPTANRPEAYESGFQDNLRLWREDWQNTCDAVDDFAQQVHKYYEIDGDTEYGDGGRLEEIWRKFGIDTQTPQQLEERATGYRPPLEGGTVNAELAYARYYVDEHIYNQLLDIRDEIPLGEDGKPIYIPYMPGPIVNVVSEHWTGPAASAFFWNLAVPFDEAAGRQLVYLRELASIVHIFRLIRDHTSTCLRKVIDNTIRNLGGGNEMEPMIPGDPIDISLGDAVNAAGLIIASLGLITASGGTGIVIGVLGVGQAFVSIGLAEAAKNEGPDDIDLHVAELAGPTSPWPVILSAQDAIRRIEEWQGRKDDAIARGLRTDMDDTTAFASPKLSLKEPGEFSDTYEFDLNETTMQEGVTAPINALRRAGRDELRGTAAGHIENAMDNLLDVNIVPSWVFHFLPRSWDAYNEATGGLVSSMRTTAANLRLWGNELVEIANEYEVTDEENAGGVNRAGGN
ncbi:MAG TPA: hypothetical protein VIL37_21290 [Natronosporangium sp.]